MTRFQVQIGQGISPMSIAVNFIGMGALFFFLSTNTHMIFRSDLFMESSEGLITVHRN